MSGLVPDGKGGFEPSPESWAELGRIQDEVNRDNPYAWDNMLNWLFAEDGASPEADLQRIMAVQRPANHAHDCACGGWSHCEPGCEYTAWWPCGDCEARVESGEE